MVTAFMGSECVRAGRVGEVVEHLAARKIEGVLIFDDAKGTQIDFDLSGTPREAGARAVAAMVPAAKAGRPRLGVVAREITLLPRHWEWLEQQPSGASGAIRRLVDEARKAEGADQRAAADAACRIMSSLAGNLPGYEEAMRALYAGDRDRFFAETATWPRDVREYLGRVSGLG